MKRSKKMKNLSQRIIEYVMKSKKRKVYCILGLVYFLAVVFVMNDAWLYQTPIAKLTKVETRMTGEGKSTRGTKEKKYEQNIQGVVLNGKNKGKKVSFSHEYTYTGMLKQGYHKGEKVFLNGSKDDVGSGIRGVKRDTEIVVLLGFLILLLLIVTGRHGALTVGTVIINLIIFFVGFWKCGDSSNVLSLCNKLCVLAMIMGIFDLVMRHMEELDYSTMEYLGSIDNPDEMFHAEILLSGLGAIMDVSVAISVALSEIVRKKPDVTFFELFKSGREIGYDIMGTMINVLLFVFGCGLIPMCLIRMNNSVRFVTIIKLHIPCELCRFFVESIGIVLAIPVSIIITSVMMKMSAKKVKKIC